MDHQEEVEVLYKDIGELINGKDRGVVLQVLGMLHSDCALQFTTDEDSIRELYKMMGDAAVLLAEIDGSNKLQAKEDSPQKTPRAKKGQKAGNVPGSSNIN